MYTAKDWNPLTYEESVNPRTSAVVAYRGSKKFAELAAWEFLEKEKPRFDIVTLCPPMTFGPIAHPVRTIEQLNESNATLSSIAAGVDPLPVARVPAWINVRDLAEAHVQALLRLETEGKRYVPAAQEKFSYDIAAEIMKEYFAWARDSVSKKDSGAKALESYDLDGLTVAKELGVTCRTFEETVVDLVRQLKSTLARDL
jgi:nucleoside-diphosphate-sugar epimerase